MLMRKSKVEQLLAEKDKVIREKEEVIVMEREANKDKLQAMKYQEDAFKALVQKAVINLENEIEEHYAASSRLTSKLDMLKQQHQHYFRNPFF